MATISSVPEKLRDDGTSWFARSRSSASSSGPDNRVHDAGNRPQGVHAMGYPPLPGPSTTGIDFRRQAVTGVDWRCRYLRLRSWRSSWSSTYAGTGQSRSSRRGTLGRKPRTAALMFTSPGVRNPLVRRQTTARLDHLGHADPGFILRVHVHLMPAAGGRAGAYY